MCWLHYFPTSPRWMADLWREWWATAPSFPGHKDREGSWDGGPSQGHWLSISWGTLLPCTKVKIGLCKQMSLPNANRAAEKSARKWPVLLFIQPLWKLISGVKSSHLTVHRQKDGGGGSFYVFGSTLKPQHFTELLLKINVHLDTNKPYGFSK